MRILYTFGKKYNIIKKAVGRRVKLNSIDDIIALHMSNGKIEDGYKKIHFDNKVFILNKFTLRVKRGNMSKEEAKRWNLIIQSEVKKDRNLYKETKEFVSLFQLFNRVGIRSGYIKKNESPDFIVSRNNEITGIEITRIYVGNDWIAEKVSEEIKAFKERKRDAIAYDEYRRFHSKIVSFKIRGGTVIMATGENEISKEEYLTEIKNKIFEKIRKLIDDYQKCKNNIIFVDVVSSVYFSEQEDIEKLNDEIKFYISHLDGFSYDGEYILILKSGDDWTKFDLKNGNYGKI